MGLHGIILTNLIARKALGVRAAKAQAVVRVAKVLAAVVARAQARKAPVVVTAVRKVVTAGGNTPEKITARGVGMTEAIEAATESVSSR